MRIGRERGLATVEFAIVALVLLTVLIAVIDISRWFFISAAANEATRRGARVAAVCPVNDPAIARVAVFSDSGGGDQSPLVNGLETRHIRLEYLDRSGDQVADPGGAGFGQVRYVRVSLTDDFQIETMIPGVAAFNFGLDFATTLPRESLGIPRQGTVVPC